MPDIRRAQFDTIAAGAYDAGRIDFRIGKDGSAKGKAPRLACGEEPPAVPDASPGADPAISRDGAGGFV